MECHHVPHVSGFRIAQSCPWLHRLVERLGRDKHQCFDLVNPGICRPSPASDSLLFVRDAKSAHILCKAVAGIILQTRNPSFLTLHWSSLSLCPSLVLSCALCLSSSLPRRCLSMSRLGFLCELSLPLSLALCHSLSFAL